MLATLPDFPKRSALTRRYLEVVDGLVHGLSNKEIARQLSISPRTVEDYRHRVYEKLGVQNSVQLTRHVYQVGATHAQV